MTHAPSGVESDEIIAGLKKRGYLPDLPSVEEFAAGQQRQLEQTSIPAMTSTSTTIDAPVKQLRELPTVDLDD